VAPQSVQIQYRRSGGLAGLDMTAQAASDELAADHADLARKLLTDPPAAASTPPAAGGADQFSYRLHVDDGTRQRTFTWADHEVPDEVRPLLAALNRKAHPAPPA
jgi:hypothetical protein